MVHIIDQLLRLRELGYTVAMAPCEQLPVIWRYTTKATVRRGNGVQQLPPFRRIIQEEKENISIYKVFYAKTKCTVGQNNKSD